MKSAYLMAAMPSGVFVRLLLRNGIGFRPKYLFRLLFILQSGMWSSLLQWRERRAIAAKLNAAKAPPDPLVIVCHWRTGSNLLHQLINCDPQFSAPTLYQVSYPTSFITSRRYVEPIMKRMLLPLRPMDNVRLSMDGPEEEEGALFRICGLSPFERLIFPHSRGYFLLDDETFLPEPSRRARWDEALLHFVTKLHMATGRRIVLKNPFHSVRIRAIMRLFPLAKFIHIYRDPRVVIPSTARMWTIVGAQNAMRPQWRPPLFEDVVTVFDRIMSRMQADLDALPYDRYTEIKFEQLEKQPLSVIRKAYERLDLNFSADCERAMGEYLRRVSSYQKNTYSLTSQQESLIRSRLGSHIQRGGYEA
jgi:hypothetical protein